VKEEPQAGPDRRVVRNAVQPIAIGSAEFAELYGDKRPLGLQRLRREQAEIGQPQLFAERQVEPRDTARQRIGVIGQDRVHGSTDG